MCGIAGIYRPLKASTSTEEMRCAVEAMEASLVHRGPDASGLWVDPDGRCVLGHRRLSIIDTSDAGRQPMATADGRFVLSYNGELYNYLQIKADLEAAGHQFRGRTDTEVVLQAFVAWGTDAFARFDGMFALAIMDTQSGELVLARDAFGEKPLYYSQLGNGTYAFASELQAIELAPTVDLTVSVDAMAEMLSFQYVGAPRSIYTSTKKLRPGHWLRIEPSGRVQIGRFFTFRPGSTGYIDRPLKDLADELEEILVSSIQRRLIADVPVGAFLSGGVDSSTVCALIRRRLNRPLMTFSIGFEGASESEHLIARKFGSHLGTSHFDQILSPNAAEFLLDFGAKVDEPNGDSSCLPTYLLSEFARQHVTVSISGDGGDEMFGGYGRYMHTLDQQRRYEEGEAPGWKPGSAYYGSSILVGSEPLIQELFGFVPQGFADHVGLLRTDLDESQDALLEMMRQTDVENYMPGAVLPKVDRMSMQNSLEVRTPFLNVELARFAERMPERDLVQGGRGKLVLKEIAYRYLPRELVDLPKQGFALPMSDWAKDSLLDISSRLLEQDDSRLGQAFGSAGIARFMARQRSPGNFSPYQVWGVVALESWLRHHPAQLPDFNEGAGTFAQGTAHNRSDDLVAAQVGDKVFIIADGSSGPDEDQFANLPREIEVRAFQLLSEAAPAPDEASTTVHLPAWGSSDAPDRSVDLKGAMLLATGREAALRLDYRAIENLRAQGVSKVIVRNPYVNGELLEVSMRQRISSADHLQLFRQRCALLSTSRAVRVFGARALRKEKGLAWQSPVLRALPAFPDIEFATDFAVFEGGRQLPPLPLSHEIIAREGGGRYSIFDQRLTVSATEPGREGKPIWVVPINAENRDKLSTVVSRWSERSLAADQGSAIDELVQRPSDFEPVRAGDPIVLCTHSLPPGGAERQWVYLAQALKAAGYDVTFVTFRKLEGARRHYLQMLQDSGIRHVDASAVSAIASLRAWPKSDLGRRLTKTNLVPDRECVARLVAVFTKIAPKAVISQLDDPNILAGLAAEVAGVPRQIMSFRNYNPTNFPYISNDWYRPAYQALSKSPRVLLSGNHAGANEDYAEWIGIDPRRVAHIPNAVDSDVFVRAAPEEISALRRSFGLPTNAQVILGVARLSAEKDPSTWIEVAGRVLRANPDAHAFLVGVGPLKSRLEDKIAALGMSDRIRLLGARTDVHLLMSMADIFLLTSRFEGMPNVVMEAGSIGIPVVATAAGGSAELIEDSRTGFVHPIGDVDGLAASCLELLSDPARASAMGCEARILMQIEFNKTKLGERYIALLNSLIRDRGSQSLDPEQSYSAPDILDQEVRVATKAR